MKSLIKKLLREATEEKLDPKKIKIKKQLTNNLLVYLPFYDGNRMGAFRLKPYGDDFKIFGTVLYDDYKGKGFGTGMYKYIIRDLSRNNKSLYSDDMQSNDAKRVWDSLVTSGFAEKSGETYKSKI